MRIYAESELRQLLREAISLARDMPEARPETIVEHIATRVPAAAADLNESQIRSAVLDLAEHGFVYLNSRRHAEQVYQAIDPEMRPAYQLTGDQFGVWRIERG